MIRPTRQRVIYNSLLRNNNKEKLVIYFVRAYKNKSEEHQENKNCPFIIAKQSKIFKLVRGENIINYFSLKIYYI